MTPTSYKFENRLNDSIVIKTLSPFEDMLYVDEQIFGIAYETGVDRTIVEASKNLSKEWKNEIRER